MKSAAIMAGIVLTILPAAASANPEEDAAKAVIKAVKHGEDLNAAFPGAITPREIASLQRVSKCTPFNLMKQGKGDYTVIWDCGTKGVLGMEVVVTDTRVTSVSTMPLERRPD